MSLNGQNNTQNVLQAILNRVQELENAAWSVLSALSVGAATGDLLNTLGKLVGEPRLGRVDADYQAAIRLRIRVNRSKGRAADVIDVGVLASTNGSVPNYLEYYPAAWVLDILNLPSANQVVPKLRSTRAAGTYGLLQFTSNASATLVLDWTTTAQAGAGVLDWSGGSVATPGQLSAALAV